MCFALLASKQKIRTQLIGLYSKLLTTPCLLCGKPERQTYLCSDCQHSLTELTDCCPRCALSSPGNQICGRCLRKPPLRDSTTSIYVYHDAVARLITNFKFHKQHFLSRFFAEQLAQKRLGIDLEMPDLLIPIPLYPRRMRERGYNQGNELAKDLSRILNIPIDNTSLRRVKDTLPQTSLSLSQRKKNLKQAFELKSIPKANHIALIDDVLTTGHTAETAAKILKFVGVKTVEVWTIARTIRHDAQQG